MKKIYKRWAQKALERYLKYFRVVCVLGPRQCGKSTMLEKACINHAVYKTLDITSERIQAEDTEFFLKSYRSGTLIIDEIQRVPELILGIKRIVDIDSRAGQYVLAGSADYRSIPSVNESLAGRAAIVNMRPLTQAEIKGVEPEFLTKLFKKDFNFEIDEAFGKLDLFDLVIRGGFPEVQFLPQEILTDWFSMYVENQVMRDMSETIEMRQSTYAVRTYLKSIALASAGIKNITDIAQDSGLNRLTVQKYSNGLESLFLLNEVPAWSTSAQKGLKKKPKLFMVDSGLMAYLLSVHSREQILEGLATSDRYWGALVETWVYNQLASETDLHRAWNLYHWRNQQNEEIDLLVENEDGKLLGIEVKASQTIHSNDFVHLDAFAKTNDKRDFLGIVLYAGSEIIRRSDYLYAIPVSALWSKGN